ncbi:MAG: YqgE/AlgH family protein [Spirochaetia bacterium]|nr:YqgE/AlgH family protein [Spirochaetia bacterium]
MDFLKGFFLISNSTLKEKSFNESVIFIVEHNEEGAFGLVVNQLEEIKYLDQMPEVIKKGELFKVYRGGPVREEILFILYNSRLHSGFGEEIIPDVFLGTSIELIEILAEENLPYHIYHGYAGWAPGQLESELEAKTWMVMPAQKEMIFHSNPEIVWREALLYNGGIFSYFAKNIKDPFLN